jgi:hypothetical protein
MGPESNAMKRMKKGERNKIETIEYGSKCTCQKPAIQDSVLAWFLDKRNRLFLSR